MFRTDDAFVEDAERTTAKVVDPAPFEPVVAALLPLRGAVMALDEVIDALSFVSRDPYAVVASMVRDRRLVVEFEAAPRPFPLRDVLVRRL